MMKNIKLILTGLVILLSVIGCEDDTNPAEDQFVYPLAIGNRWEYRREFVVHNYPNATQTDSCIDMISGSDSCSVIVVQQTRLRDSIETVQLMEQAWEDTSIVVGLYYYQERDTGLFEIAYQNPYLSALPKSTNSSWLLDEPLMPTHLKELFYGKLPRFNKPSDYGEIYYEDPAIFVLKYPLEAGASWIYRQEGHPWRMDREVIGDTTITVPAGTFDCFQVRLSYEHAKTIFIENDFIAKEGLILRKIDTQSEISEESGTIYSRWDDEYKLMNYNSYR
jgi:hypothetical protein